MNESAVGRGSWLKQLDGMIEVKKVIDKHADDIGEKTEKAGVQNVVEVLHSRILGSLNGKWLGLTDARILGRQGYRLTWATLRKKNRVIGVSACVVNSQGCHTVAKVFLEVVVGEKFSKSKILDLSSHEQ